MSAINVVVAEAVPEASTGLLRVLEQYEQVRVVGYAYDGVEAAQVAVRLRPHVLLLPAALPGMSGYEVCRIVSQAAPEVACALLIDTTSDEVMQSAMMAGARAIITPDTKATDIHRIIRELAKVRQVRESEEFARCTDVEQAPVGVAVCAPRGGSGCTTVAVNIAVLLAQKSSGSAVMVDLHPLAARGADLLNIEPPGTVWELAEIAEQMDDAILDSFLATHESGLKLLAGGKVATPHWIDKMTYQFLSDLLGRLRRRFRYVLLDVPPLVWQVPAYAMKRCERVFVVSEARDGLWARDTAAFVQSLEAMGVPKANMQLVVNRVSKNDVLTPEQLAEVCGLDGVLTIPNDTKAIADASRAGQPVVTHSPSAPVSKALAELVERMCAERCVAEAA